MRLEQLLRSNKRIRVVGFDDGPFVRRHGASVPICGVVCAGTRFEGMVWGSLRQDGWNATDVLIRLLVGGKFHPQSHLVLIDGIAFGGFNVVHLPSLAATLELPCVAVMRRPPDQPAVESAIRKLPSPERRLRMLLAAGPIHSHNGFTFQVCGAAPEAIGDALQRLTDRGAVPEALRIAHLIAGAVSSGQSGRRA